MKTRINRTIERDEYIESLNVTASGKVRLCCCFIGCRNSDLMLKKEAIDIINASWPYNDYICRKCYERGR